MLPQEGGGPAGHYSRVQSESFCRCLRSPAGRPPGCARPCGQTAGLGHRRPPQGAPPSPCPCSPSGWGRSPCPLPPLPARAGKERCEEGGPRYLCGGRGWPWLLLLLLLVLLLLQLAGQLQVTERGGALSLLLLQGQGDHIVLGKGRKRGSV